MRIGASAPARAGPPRGGEEALERLTSRATLHQAFERVRENSGCRGADGVTVGRFAADLTRQLDSLEDSFLTRSYRPYPLLRFAIPKPTGGQRFLAVPTVRDRVAQSAAYLATQPVFEAEFEESSYAYRPGRSVKSAVARIQEHRDKGFRWVVDADIDDFFANLSHDRLLDRLGRLALPGYLLQLFESWIRAEIYDGESLWTVSRGIPQGSVVSPVLANLFLDELDEALAHHGQTVVRYGDDFLVLCREPEEAEQALELTDRLLEDMELDLNREKTLITSFGHGFKFLGALFVGDAIYLPFRGAKKKRSPIALPPPLDAATYERLKKASAP